MKISVVTISYNQAAFLQACIDSVACQAGEWEHIIVDAGSTDGSREIIEQNRQHFSHVVLEKDDGPADGLNKGFALASGTHGFFINSDDFLLPNAFAVFADLVAAHPDSDVFLCGGWLVDADDQPIRRVKPTHISTDSLLDGSAVMFQQGMLFSMKAYNGVHGFNAKNKLCWDFELLCDFIAQPYTVTRSSHRVGAFRIYSGTISDLGQTGYLDDLARELERIAGRILGDHRKIVLGKRSASLRRYMWNPWVVREVIERDYLRGKLASIWKRDSETDRASRDI